MAPCGTPAHRSVAFAQYSIVILTSSLLFPFLPVSTRNVCSFKGTPCCALQPHAHCHRYTECTCLRRSPLVRRLPDLHHRVQRPLACRPEDAASLLQIHAKYRQSRLLPFGAVHPHAARERFQLRPSLTQDAPHGRQHLPQNNCLAWLTPSEKTHHYSSYALRHSIVRPSRLHCRSLQLRRCGFSGQQHRYPDASPPSTLHIPQRHLRLCLRVHQRSRRRWCHRAAPP